jgi:galactokinase
VAVQRIDRPVLDITSAGRKPYTLALKARRSRQLRGGAGIVCEEPDRWAAYVAAVFIVLTLERGIRFDDGARIAIESSVPEGKGVSSSAAIETATMEAVARAFDVPIEPMEMALLCQKAETWSPARHAACWLR